MKLKTIMWRKNISLKGLGSGQALDGAAQDGAFGLFLEEFFPDLSCFTLFAVGHSATLLIGVLNGWHINAYLVDAVIGLSIVYRAFDNLGGFQTMFGVQPDKKASVLFFGFVHGLGLATKLQDFALSPEGLIPNMIAFNVGVEIGQLLALGMILTAMRYWRTRASFTRHVVTSNVVLMSAGFVLAGIQLTGFFIT